MLTGLRKFLQIMAYVLLSALFILLFAGLIVANEQSVSVGFWSWMAGPYSLSLILFLVFFLGVVLGLLTGILVLFRITLRNRSLQRKLKRRDNELQKLRVSALRGLSP